MIHLLAYDVPNQEFTVKQEELEESVFTGTRGPSTSHHLAA